MYLILIKHGLKDVTHLSSNHILLLNCKSVISIQKVVSYQSSLEMS